MDTNNKTVEERVEYYTRALNLPIEQPPQDKTIIKFNAQTDKDYKDTHPSINRNMKHVQKILNHIGASDDVYMQYGDKHIDKRVRFPILSYYSPTCWRPDTEFYGGIGHEQNGQPVVGYQNKYGVCFKANIRRWFEADHNEIPYDDRLDVCQWRGSKNGHRNLIGNRCRLVETWHGKRDYMDINYLAPTKILMNGKYLISAPGNMNESGVFWKLRSGAVVIMPKPNATTWLMEDTLIAGEHYLQVKDDWSDLDAVVDEARTSHKRNKQIAQNARQYTEQFLNDSRELAIESEVISRYCEVIKC